MTDFLTPIKIRGLTVLMNVIKTKEIFSNPQHAYTKMLLASEPKPLESTQKDESVSLQVKSLSVRFNLKK